MTVTTAGLEDLPATARRVAVEQLVCGLPGGRAGEMSFDEPWEIRAFALAVAAHQAGEYLWPQFQGALIDSIRSWESEHPQLQGETWSYYEHWVLALEQVLSDAGIVNPDEVDARTKAVLATPANRGHHEAHTEPIAVDPAR